MTHQTKLQHIAPNAAVEGHHSSYLLQFSTSITTIHNPNAQTIAHHWYSGRQVGTPPLPISNLKVLFNGYGFKVVLKYSYSGTSIKDTEKHFSNGTHKDTEMKGLTDSMP